MENINQKYLNQIVDLFQNETRNRHIEFLRLLPNDQYVCPECKEVPEILGIDYDDDYKIELECKNHKKEKIPIDEYFQKEERHLYINEICGKDEKTVQKNYKHCLFDFCKGCNIFLCGACSLDHPHQSSFIKINEYNNMCKKHCQKYINYCKECQKHLCKECMKLINFCSFHNLERLDQMPDEEKINILYEERENLIRQKNLIEHLIKFIETVLTTYSKHSTNYFHYININNLANSIILRKNYLFNREQLIAKLDDLESLARHYLNVKLKIELTGNEISINLNNKNITNIDFQLLSEIKFKNAKIMSLNNNIISDITPLKNFKSPNLKVLDLSYNKINNINSFEDFSKKEQKIETILLNNNEINNADVFKKKIFPYIKEINLDENKLFPKDIQEIKDIINGIKRKKVNFKKNGFTQRSVSILKHNKFNKEIKEEEIKPLKLPPINFNRINFGSTSKNFNKINK